jgi:hypothetical protein
MQGDCIIEKSGAGTSRRRIHPHLFDRDNPPLGRLRRGVYKHLSSVGGDGRFGGRAGYLLCKKDSGFARRNMHIHRVFPAVPHTSFRAGCLIGTYNNLRLEHTIPSFGGAKIQGDCTIGKSGVGTPEA